MEILQTHGVEAAHSRRREEDTVTIGVSLDSIKEILAKDYATNVSVRAVPKFRTGPITKHRSPMHIFATRIHYSDNVYPYGLPMPMHPGAYAMDAYVVLRYQQSRSSSQIPKCARRGRE